MTSENKLDEDAVGNAASKQPSRLLHLAKTSIVPLLGLTIAAISFFVLWELLKTTSRHDTIEAFKSYTTPTLLLALFFTILSFCGIALYDVVAARTIAPGKITMPLQAL